MTEDAVPASESSAVPEELTVQDEVVVSEDGKMIDGDDTTIVE